MSAHILFLIWRGALGGAFGIILGKRGITISTWQFWVLVVLFTLNSIPEGA
jgi:hypothetical protein